MGWYYAEIKQDNIVYYSWHGPADTVADDWSVSLFEWTQNTRHNHVQSSLLATVAVEQLPAQGNSKKKLQIWFMFRYVLGCFIVHLHCLLLAHAATVDFTFDHAIYIRMCTNQCIVKLRIRLSPGAISLHCEWLARITGNIDYNLSCFLAPDQKNRLYTLT